MLKRFRRLSQNKKLLKDVKKNYMDSEVPMMRAPVRPIYAVTESYVAVSENSLAYRNTVLIPLLLVLSLGGYFFVKDFYTSWLEHEKRNVDIVESKKIKHGGKYFLESDNINDMKIYYSIDAGGEMPLSHYLEYRYQNTKLPSYLSYLKLAHIDLVVALLIIFVIPLLVLIVARFRKRAPLYFDRDRGVVYTWLLGRAWAQSYDQLEYMSTKRALVFVLYAENSATKGSERHFSIQPSGSLLFNGDAYYEQLLSAICQFMEKGMDRVWDDEWSENVGLLLRDDPMPDDFHEQIERVLEGLPTY